MNTEVIDSGQILFRKYEADGRVVVVAGDKEFGLPQYKIEVDALQYGVFHELYGMPYSLRVTARDSKTNELVLSFHTRT